MAPGPDNGSDSAAATAGDIGTRAQGDTATARPRPIWFSRSLSAKVLLLTALFVMLVEVLVFAPSVAKFRLEYLDDRLRMARLAVLAMLTAPDFTIADDLADQILTEANLHFIVVREAVDRKIMLARDMPPTVDVTYDLRGAGPTMLIIDALAALVRPEDRVIRVLGKASKPMNAEIEIVLDERPMIEAMQAYGFRIFLLSSFIALVTAGLLYVALRWLIVRPMQRLTESMAGFRDDPFDATRTLTATGREDEIGRAIAECGIMQLQIRTALHQKTRLAQLGEAVAKFNHDLRNILSSALLIADRLAMLPDEQAQKLSQPLIDTIDRAVNLCGQTLVFVREGQVPLTPSRFRLADLVGDVARTLAVGNGNHGKDAAARTGSTPTDWQLDNRVPANLTVTADCDALDRALGNLMRNAVEAGARTVTVTAQAGSDRVKIVVADDGPGIPDKIRETLFQPFAGSAKPGGTGLGLVNARELLQAHGGGLRLLDTNPQGSRFELDLPIR